MTFNFGSTANKPAFGTTTTTTSSSMFGGTGGFGGTSTSGAFGGFNTGSTFGTTSTLGGNTLGGGSTFGTSGANTFGGGTSFGGGNTLGGGSTFGGGLGATSAGFGGPLGGGLSSTSGGFGGGLGTGLNTSSALSTGFGGTGGFGSALGSNMGGTGLGTALNLTNPQQQKVNDEQAKAMEVANLATAVSLPVIFGDERDSTLAKWNQLQAYWGFGKAFYTLQGANVPLDASNPFCRFKAVGYSVMPKTRNKDGIVGIIFNKKIEDIQNNQAQIVDFIHKACGGKPNVTICVESVKPLPEDKAEMLIYVQERSLNGTTKKLQASDVFNGFNTPNIRNHLVSNIAVETIIPKTGLTVEQLKQYLDTPPNGIDPLIWRQAKLDNPDPENLIPVPMIGFQELQKRLKHQEQQTKLHQARLDIISQDISKLQSKQTDMLAKMEQYKRKHLELSHKVLQVMVRQEVYRKLGYSIQADEEALRVQLEVNQAELNAPTQFKGRLNELMSQLRMQSKLGGGRPEASCHMDSSIQLEIKQFLKQQQDGLQHLMMIIRDDLDDLRIIDQGYTDTPMGHVR